MEETPKTEFKVPEGFPEVLGSSVIIKPLDNNWNGLIKIIRSQILHPGHGIVMAKGPDCMGKFELGMEIIYVPVATKFGQYVIHEGETYLIMHETSVFGKIVSETDEYGVVPFNKNVFFRKGQNDIQAGGGIIIPGTTQKVMNVGYIISVGENVERPLKPGQKIVHNLFADQEFMFRNREIKMLSEIDIFAIIPDNAYSAPGSNERQKRADVPLDQLPDIEKPDAFKGTITHTNPHGK